MAKNPQGKKTPVIKQTSAKKTDAKTKPAKSGQEKTLPASRRKMSQGMLITLITSGVTILAALIPYILPAKAPAPEATSTLAPPTATLIPPTATITSTATPEPPTLTSTPEFGIFDVYLAQDKEGQNKTFSFSPLQTIYMTFNLNDPADLNNVKIVWSVVEVKGYKSGAIIHQTEDVLRVNTYTVVANNEPWDPGKYRVDLFLNEVLDETVEFEILQ
jgi:hypothetical protein